MTKDELLAVIRRAKSSHIQWRAYAQGMVSGIPVDEDRAPVMHTDCKFGKWYYGEGKQQLGHLDIYQDIEGPHELLHAVYRQIHGLMDAGNKDQAQSKLEELVGISTTLLQLLELLESEVNSLPQTA